MRTGALLGLMSLVVALGVTAPAAAQFPGTNGKIFFTGSDLCVAPATSCIEKMDPNGSNRALVLNLAGDHVHVSSNGARIVFDLFSNGRSRIFIATVNGRHLTDLTPKAVDDEDPAWSPNGRWVVFSNQTSTAKAGLYRIRIDRTHLKRLTGPTGQPEEPDWSVHGVIAFHVGGGISTMPAGGGAATDLGVSGGGPSFSPDGNTIAFAGSGIETIPVGGGSATTIDSTNFDDHPVFSPDGTLVAFDNAGVIKTVPSAGGSASTVGSGSGPGWQPLP